MGSTGFVDADESTGVASAAAFCVDGASVFAAGCVGFDASFAGAFGASAEGFAVAFGASEAAVAEGVFVLVVGAAEVSVFAIEERVDEAGAVY